MDKTKSEILAKAAELERQESGDGFWKRCAQRELEWLTRMEADFFHYQQLCLAYTLGWARIGRKHPNHQKFNSQAYQLHRLEVQRLQKLLES